MVIIIFSMARNGPQIEAELRELFATRIVLLDGAMGTTIQLHKLEEADYRGDRFQSHPKDLMNNNDVLNITKFDLIKLIHRQYLEAGADIVETNSFNGTTLV
jgi:5-methyltetrahydrofolate--homocysteine methyltransferase